jgi:hypothetical protein
VSQRRPGHLADPRLIRPTYATALDLTQIASVPAECAQDLRQPVATAFAGSGMTSPALSGLASDLVALAISAAVTFSG